MVPSPQVRRLSLIAATSLACALVAQAQSPSPLVAPVASPSPSAAPSPNPVAIANRRAAFADRLKMLALLHIPDFLQLTDPNQKPPHVANYDESKASPFPLTNPLQLKDGRIVRRATTWQNVRRPEILHDITTEIYGKIPSDAPKVTWEVTNVSTSGTNGATVKSIVGHIDNSSWPAASAHIDLTLYLPASATGPVPVIVQIISGNPPGMPARDPGPLQQILAKGWGCATTSTYTVQADTGAGLSNGVIGIVNKGQSRQTDQWGVLAAWSWGLGRVIDYLETDKAVDAKRLGVEGHSRWGKTALLCAALDPRWSIVYASCSGQCGAKPSRRDWGETVDNICGVAEYDWMAGNYLKYAGHWDQLPVDSPELISLVAPRPVFIGCGSTDKWADPHGQFLAVVAAGPVWRLLGAKDVGASIQPGPDVALISGDIGYRMHNGGHTDALDFPTFLDFAAKYWNKPATAQAQAGN